MNQEIPFSEMEEIGNAAVIMMRLLWKGRSIVKEVFFGTHSRKAIAEGGSTKGSPVQIDATRRRRKYFPNEWDGRYYCGKCGKGFAKVENLRNHVSRALKKPDGCKNHTRRVSYVCNICKTDLKRKDRLRRHANKCTKENNLN